MCLEKQKQSVDPDVLQGVICDTIQDLAFMFAEPVEDGDAVNIEKKPFAHATMEFKNVANDIQGKVGLICSNDLCNELSANILGDVDEPYSNEHPEDALKELLNIVCGKLTTSLYGENIAFDLSIPRVSKPVNNDWNDIFSNKNTVKFMIDDKEPLFAYLVI